MDDYFSGLLSRHINELRLDSEEPTKESKQKEEKNEDKSTENIPVTIESEESIDSHSSRSLTPPPIYDSSPVHQSSSSTTNSSTGSNSSSNYVSLRDYQSPQINHERENPSQLLVAIIGREFDEPQSIVSKLSPLIPFLSDSFTPVLKLIPFTVRRSVLVKANFDWQELKELDLVCMCYNASEARILLTGPDGFYTQLIKKLETVLGSNKIAFLITNYLSEENSTPSLLIDTHLRTRLAAQSSLTTYLETSQVLSWFQDPCESHVTKLIELARSEPNPSNFCLIL